MRHTWDKTKWESEGWAVCTRCGCVREKHWPCGYVYYAEDMHNVELPFYIKSPECTDKNNQK